MSNFVDLRYVDASGASAPVDAAHPDNPYFGQSPLARKVLMGDMGRLRWQDGQGRLYHADFQSPVVAAVDPRSDLLVAVVHFSDPQYRVPLNGIVLNPDASLNHRIVPPAFVEKVIEQLPNRPAVTQQMPVEALYDVLIQNGRTLIGLNFDYEWIERRYYDPAARQWQERDQIFRK